MSSQLWLRAAGCKLFFCRIAGTTTGRTLGAVAYLNRGEWSFIPEYDFNSNWTGEDSFSIKVSKSFAKMSVFRSGPSFQHGNRQRAISMDALLSMRRISLTTADGSAGFEM